MTNHYDTIIVGAGLAGLTAATHLAQSGRRPLVLERNSELGGRARTDDLDGWLFNHGGHALYRDGIGHQALRALGVEVSGDAPPLTGGQLIIGDKATVLPIDARRLIQTRALSAGGKLQFGKLMATLGKLDASSYADVTVDDWLGKYRPDVQAVAKAFVRLSTYSGATDVMSADAAISQLSGAQAGVLYLHDGWAALCEQIANAADSAGATITPGAAVSSITKRDIMFTVASAETTFTATTVIVAAGGPQLTARLLGVNADTFGTIGPPPEAAVLDLALDTMPANYRFALGVDEPTYFSVHSPPARLAPRGKVAAVAMRYLSPGDDGSADAHRASLDAIARVAGIGAPVRSRFLRRMTVTNGLPIAAAGGVAGRPGIEMARMPGVFVAGDWVGPRGLLADAAIASGMDAGAAAERAVGLSPSTTLT